MTTCRSQSNSHPTSNFTEDLRLRNATLNCFRQHMQSQGGRRPSGPVIWFTGYHSPHAISHRARVAKMSFFFGCRHPAYRTTTSPSLSALRQYTYRRRDRLHCKGRVLCFSKISPLRSSETLSGITILLGMGCRKCIVFCQ